MSRYELNRSIEARKLHPRTGIPTTEPPVTIPFGAFIQELVEDRDVQKFVYLGDRYQVQTDVLRHAMVLVPTATAAPAEPAAPPAAPTPVLPPQIVWQTLVTTGQSVQRARVAGGWLVASGSALAFVPDPDGAWLPI
jgi:hypothetical protein